MNFIDKIENILQERKNDILSAYLENINTVNEIISWFEDEKSKNAYENMLMYKILEPLIGATYAVHYASCISEEQFLADKSKAKKMFENGELPQIDFGDARESMIYYLYTCTFIYEQYKYLPYVTIDKANHQGKGDIFLDCGGCTGDTAIWAALQGARVYSFEPSPINFKFLVKNIKSLSLQDKIYPVASALGEEVGSISFEQDKNGNPGASRIGKPSNTSLTLPVTTLDIWLNEHSVQPDFIKMDMEGAELGTIIGGAQSIKKYKPKLAISIYHSMSDMWTIPKLIKELVPEYHFWCRKNAPRESELILYASIT